MSKPTANSHSNILVAREKIMSHHNAVECVHIVIWKVKVIAMHNCMESIMVGNLKYNEINLYKKSSVKKYAIKQ